MLSLLPHSNVLSSGMICLLFSPWVAFVSLGPVSVSLGSSPVAPASFAQPCLPAPSLQLELLGAPTHLMPTRCPQGGWAQCRLGIAALPTDARAALGMPGRRGGWDEPMWARSGEWRWGHA